MSPDPAAGRRTVTVIIGGRPVRVPAGTSVAAALLVASDRPAAEAGGLFCGMGCCYGCLATIDGQGGVRTCITPVADGMRVGPADEVSDGD